MGNIVDKPAVDINPAMLSAMTPGLAIPLAGIIEVSAEESLSNHTGEPSVEVRVGDTGTKVAFQKLFEANGHNYLFTSKCCEDCIKVKHKKMLRAYLIDHGAVPGLRLWWKVWRATR